MLNEKLFCPEKGLNQNLRHFLNGNYFIDGNSIKAKPFKESEYFLKDNPSGFGYYYETANAKDYDFYATYYHSIKSMDLKYYGELLHYDKTVAIKHSVSAVFDLGDYHYLDCESVTILDFLHFYPNLQKKGLNVKSQNCEMYHVPFHIASKNTRLEWYYRIVSCKNNEHLRNLGNKEDSNDIFSVEGYIGNLRGRGINPDGLFFEVKFVEFEAPIIFKHVRNIFDPDYIEQITPFSEDCGMIKFTSYELKKGNSYCKQPILYNAKRINFTIQNIKLKP